ncbi:hypothetical protein OSL60_29320, partial [Escherichia coli]|nr:hypothetical protein [Escherichia coli]
MSGCADNFRDRACIRIVLYVADRAFADFGRERVVDDESVGVFPAGIIVSRKEPFDGETFYYL